MIIWNKVCFKNVERINYLYNVLNQKLITVPAAPTFVENINNEYYWNAIRSADFNIFDSSLFAILCRLKGYRIYKYSGYQLIKDTLLYLKHNKLRLLLVNPNQISSTINKKYIIEKTMLNDEDIISYNAPVYPKNEKIIDYNLLQLIESNEPNLIIINIAGGKQEILGAFLKKNLTFHSTILCSGAAIAYFTGEQAPITNWIDKMHLGWFARILCNPKRYFKRYLNAFRFIPLFYQYKIEEREGTRKRH